VARQINEPGLDQVGAREPRWPVHARIIRDPCARSVPRNGQTVGYGPGHPAL
jgi:hypothetical protein